MLSKQQLELAKASKNRVLLGDHSDCDPPDPISNSEVKPVSANGSVGLPHVRVGHRQALNLICPSYAGVYFLSQEVLN